MSVAIVYLCVYVLLILGAVIGYAFAMANVAKREGLREREGPLVVYRDVSDVGDDWVSVATYGDPKAVARLVADLNRVREEGEVDRGPEDVDQV